MLGLALYADKVCTKGLGFAARRLRSTRTMPWLTQHTDGTQWPATESRNKGFKGQLPTCDLKDECRADSTALAGQHHTALFSPSRRALAFFSGLGPQHTLQAYPARLLLTRPKHAKSKSEPEGQRERFESGRSRFGEPSRVRCTQAFCGAGAVRAGCFKFV